MGTPYGKFPILFPYQSHTTPIRIPKDMGMVWEAYHKGVPLLGVPENPTECSFFPLEKMKVRLSFCMYIITPWRPGDRRIIYATMRFGI